VYGQHPGGKGANQALAAQRQGAAVALIGAVGDDTTATEALAILRSEGVDLSRVVVTNEAATGVALIVVDAAAENQIAVAPGANHQLAPPSIDVSGFDAVLCQLEVTDAVVVEAARQATGLFCLNAAPSRPVPEEALGRADLVIVNETEHAMLADQLGHYGGLLVVTKGAAGAEAFRDGALVASARPPQVEAVDTVGAGDSFCGALVVALAQGAELDRALSRACTAGALAATRSGAQPSLPTAHEVESLL
jgi:ribokinase